MKKNIKYVWTEINNNLSKLYNRIKKILSNNKPVDLNRILLLSRKKPVHAALVLAIAAGTAFSGLSLLVKRAPDKSPDQIALFNDKNDGEVKESTSPYSQRFRPEAGVTASRGGVSHGDRYLMARVIEGEAADEPMKGKVAVGAVILNRTESKDFPPDISQVVYQPLAFEAVANGQYNRPLTPEALKAADLALEGNDPTSGALYYWNPAKATSRWVWQRPVTMQIGRHVFAR
ncbi:MAG TPA: hypothetical protein DEF36_03345 [Desulfotomaculum sp.]|nr:hypothetical protein [Desulfotomaculum sp.]